MGLCSSRFLSDFKNVRHSFKKFFSLNLYGVFLTTYFIWGGGGGKKPPGLTLVFDFRYS